MKNINLAKNIVDLRKKKGITQEQLATAVNVSPQAVSKWETGTSLPDIQTIPLISDYFNVSIDYLFYGLEISYDDVYDKAFKKVAEFSQMSKESYEAAFKLFASAHHGISHGNIRGGNAVIYDCPAHISNENGISLLSGRGYGSIITRDFFENVNIETIDFAMKLLPVLSDKTRLLICLAVVSMSDISYNELKEKLDLSDDTLRSSLDVLIESKIVFEKSSKHKSLGYTYNINDMYHTCLCILIATIEMQRYSNKGISCCMGYGDYPVKV